jgi:hypothetical protein
VSHCVGSRLGYIAHGVGFEHHTWAVELWLLGKISAVQERMGLKCCLYQKIDTVCAAFEGCFNCTADCEAVCQIIGGAARMQAGKAEEICSHHTELSIAACCIRTALCRILQCL